VWSRRAWGPASALRAAVRGERRREAASGGARGERSPTARGWPERLLIWAYMMSCVTCRERLKIPVCETVWHVHACSCRPAEAPRQTTRELVSTAQEAGGVKPATSPQSTAPPEGGPREAAHTAGGAQRPPIGVNARTGSATVCEPSLRTHRPQPKPMLTRGHPRRGGSRGGGVLTRAPAPTGIHRLRNPPLTAVCRPVRPCPKGKWRCAWTSWGSGLPS
jgi:hypothetical protein